MSLIQKIILLRRICINKIQIGDTAIYCGQFEDPNIEHFWPHIEIETNFGTHIVAARF